LAGGNIKGILQGLAGFKNLPHRMTFVRKLNGISFYNDSKATNTDAVIRALESFRENIILILGGREKETDFSLLVPEITGQITGQIPEQNKNRDESPNRNKVKQIIAMGEASPHIQEVLGKFCPVVQVDSMENAVKFAYENAVPGEVVLLSPACASFDMYENYGARGDDFILWVKGLEDEE
jgi:UDP-N-acetylmuramoylalanine--D-glutamate ligase